MSDRIVYLAEANRHSCRGLSKDEEGAFTALLADGETDIFIIDASAWLQSGETISSVSRAADGLTVTGTSNTTTRAVQSLTGTGDVDVKLTTTTGRIKSVVFRIDLKTRNNTPA